MSGATLTPVVAAWLLFGTFFVLLVLRVPVAFANDAKQWRDWAGNISRLSRPRAALDIAEFLLSL